MKRGAAIAFFCLGAAACGPPPRPPHATPASVDIARARAEERPRGFAWSPWSDETFARARRENKFLLIDGAAEWCHWCHVMDETTYRDPEVARALRERFVAIKVDIDARPDIGDRYAAWGWPATVILGPDAEELGKYRGYLAPEKLREILATVATKKADLSTEPDEVAAPVDALPWLFARVGRDLDAYWDAEEGGWGKRQKAPLGENVDVELLRASRGDESARARAAFVLKQQRKLIDPVWSGIYQYSAGATWDEPHFEKLMTMQAAAIEAYAHGAAVLRDPVLLGDAIGLARYVERFLTDSRGAFLPSQDADVNAHEATRPFVDGHVFYSKDDAGRRALGLPRVDPNAYPHENGLAIAAFVALFEISRDARWLALARRAADVMLASNVGADGRVRRDDGPNAIRHLGDAAWLGRGLVRLAEATAEPRYRDAAIAIAKRLDDDFAGPKGTLLSHTEDPAAAGVFARRTTSFSHSVGAARFLAGLARLTGEPRDRDRARALLAAIATPSRLEAQGRWLGGYLLAIDEAGAAR